MGDQDRDDVRFAHSLDGVAKRDVWQPGQLSRKRAQIRVGNDNPLPSAAGQLFGDLDRRALPQIIDIRLVGKAEESDDGPLEPFRPFTNLTDDEIGFCGVDLAGGA